MLDRSNWDVYRPPEQAAHRGMYTPSWRLLSVAALDDDLTARQELRRALTRRRGIALVGEAARGAELLDLITYATPAMVVLDVLLRHDNAVDLIRQLRRQHPAIKIVVVTNQLGKPLMLAALRAGAHGYLDKTSGADDIAAALRQIADGERLLPDQCAVTHVVGEVERLAHADALLRAGLAPLDRDMLGLLADGWSNHDIAERYGHSLATIKRRLSKVYAKLHARDRRGAVHEAQRRGVL